MCLGITSIIQKLVPDAVLLHADTRQKCLRILRCEKVRLMISDGTVDKEPRLGMVRKVRALQPDIKIIMLLEGTKIDHHSAIYLSGEIDRCIRKNASIERIHEAILHVLSGTEVQSL